MIKEAIEKIIDLAGKEVEYINDIPYSRHNFKAIKEPTAPVLIIHTLAGLVDYIKHGEPGEGKLLVHIYDQEKVFLYKYLEADGFTRKHLLSSEIFPPENSQYNREHYIDIELFQIMMQTRFVKTVDAEKILSLISSVESGSEIKTTDDGITQRTVAKTGIAKLGLVDIPNPVTLREYCTFPEVEQPERKYLLRAKKTDTGTKWALFTNGDNSWMNEATLNIYEYLLKNIIVAGLKDKVSIIA